MTSRHSDSLPPFEIGWSGGAYTKKGRDLMRLQGTTGASEPGTSWCETVSKPWPVIHEVEDYPIPRREGAPARARQVDPMVVSWTMSSALSGASGVGWGSSSLVPHRAPGRRMTADVRHEEAPVTSPLVGADGTIKAPCSALPAGGAGVRRAGGVARQNEYATRARREIPTFGTAPGASVARPASTPRPRYLGLPRAVWRDREAATTMRAVASDRCLNSLP
ncbi:hypothetical protein FHR55_003454 [Xanthomonas arboricola]